MEFRHPNQTALVPGGGTWSFNLQRKRHSQDDNFLEYESYRPSKRRMSLQPSIASSQSFTCLKGQMKGQLNVALYKNKSSVLVNVVQGLFESDKQTISTYVQVAIELNGEKLNTQYTKLVEKTKGPYYKEIFWFSINELHCRSRVVITVFEKVQKSSINIGCMSFGVKHILTSDKVSNGWFYLLDAETGKKKHLPVRKLTFKMHKEMVRKDPPNTLLSQIRVHSVVLSRDHRGKYGFGLQNTVPASVGKVRPGGPAYSVGVREGDTFLELDGFNVAGASSQLISNILRKSSGYVTCLLQRTEESHKKMPLKPSNQLTPKHKLPSNSLSLFYRTSLGGKKFVSSPGLSSPMQKMSLSGRRKMDRFKVQRGSPYSPLLHRRLQRELAARVALRQMRLKQRVHDGSSPKEEPDLTESVKHALEKECNVDDDTLGTFEKQSCEVFGFKEGSQAEETKDNSPVGVERESVSQNQTLSVDNGTAKNDLNLEKLEHKQEVKEKSTVFASVHTHIEQGTRVDEIENREMAKTSGNASPTRDSTSTQQNEENASVSFAVGVKPFVLSSANRDYVHVDRLLVQRAGKKHKKLVVLLLTDIVVFGKLFSNGHFKVLYEPLELNDISWLDTNCKRACEFRVILLHNGHQLASGCNSIVFVAPSQKCKRIWLRNLQQQLMIIKYRGLREFTERRRLMPMDAKRNRSPEHDDLDCKVTDSPRHEERCFAQKHTSCAMESNNNSNAESNHYSRLLGENMSSSECNGPERGDRRLIALPQLELETPDKWSQRQQEDYLMSSSSPENQSNNSPSHVIDPSLSGDELLNLHSSCSPADVNLSPVHHSYTQHSHSRSVVQSTQSTPTVSHRESFKRAKSAPSISPNSPMSRLVVKHPEKKLVRRQSSPPGALNKENNSLSIGSKFRRTIFKRITGHYRDDSSNNVQTVSSNRKEKDGRDGKKECAKSPQTSQQAELLEGQLEESAKSPQTSQQAELLEGQLEESAKSPQTSQQAELLEGQLEESAKSTQTSQQAELLEGQLEESAKSPQTSPQAELLEGQLEECAKSPQASQQAELLEGQLEESAKSPQTSQQSELLEGQLEECAKSPQASQQAELLEGQLEECAKSPQTSQQAELLEGQLEKVKTHVLDRPRQMRQLGKTAKFPNTRTTKRGFHSFSSSPQLCSRLSDANSNSLQGIHQEDPAASDVETRSLQEQPRKAKSIAKEIKARVQSLRRRHTEGSLQETEDKVTPENKTVPDAEDIKKWAEGFESLLKDKLGLEAFRKFLQTEFSDENIEFWLACEEYKNQKPSKMVARAHKIYEDYVTIQAPREVNLDSRTRLQVVSNLSHPNKHSFEQAQKRIEALMEKDSYPRFLRSEIFLKIQKAAKKNK